MKLASFRAEGRNRVGIGLADDSVVDVVDALDASSGAGDMAPFDPPDDMMAVIGGGPALLRRLQAAEKFALAQPDRVRRFPADRIFWQPPVRTPSKIVCIALNNRALDAVKLRAPTDHPAFFLKPSSALTGHNGPIRLRPSFGLTHPEPELAVVIGRTLSDVPASAVYDAVFGYTILNDITSVGMRDEDSFTFRYFKPDPRTGQPMPGEGHTSYAGRYKSSDTFAPCGPFLVTRDAIPDPAALEIRCMLGTRLVAADQARNYVWSVPEAIAQISRTMTLLPGDIVSMGTAVGGEEDDAAAPEIPGVTKANLVGYAGSVAVSISGIGTLTNPIEMIRG